MFSGVAWRIDEQVVRGELDNRVRDRVTGRIWLAGRAEPLELALIGNCWRDLAGRRLEFTNPQPKPGDLRGLGARQSGSVGDITASRKVKVPDIPLEKIGEYYAQKKPWPWHWGNSLYLEWFSESNGRVVIETTGFELKIVGESVWEMTLAEEDTQRRDNAGAITGFMDRLEVAAGDGEAGEESDPGSSEENATPLSEEAAEQIQAESDRLVDRVQARLAREGRDADYKKILHEEIERLRHERGESDPTLEQLGRRAEWIEMMNQAGREALDHSEQSGAGEIDHPLAERAQELAIRLMEASDAIGWQPADATEEHPVAELVGVVMKAGAKLAGALNGYEWPPSVADCASIIVRLKRARVYFDDALRAAESCREDKLIDFAWLGAIVIDVIDLAHDTDEIIGELRERLNGGTE